MFIKLPKSLPFQKNVEPSNLVASKRLTSIFEFKSCKKKKMLGYAIVPFPNPS